MSKKKLTLLTLFIITIATIGIVFFVGCQETPEKVVTLPFNVSYYATEGGGIKTGDDTNTKDWTFQRVEYGEDAEEVTAIAKEGYYFVQWSDGNTSATRQELNITDHVRFDAQFAKITDGVTVTYRTNETSALLWGYGNRLSNTELEQVVQRGTDGWQVEIEFIESDSTKGLIFWQWSDGVKTTSRHDTNITESFEVVALYCYPVNYGVQGEGSIIGEAEQLVPSWEYAQTVTAMPEKGYRFVEWSDGVKTATRQNDIVKAPIDVYAIFEWRETDDFVYHYDYATGNYQANSLVLTRGETEGVTAIIPEREYFTFEGWFLDEKFTHMAYDGNGNSVVGEEIFDSPSRDLYAKWTVKEEYVVTYKILMVYVTAIDGTFAGNNDTNVELHFKMSTDLKRQCIELTRKFSESLNDMLDGLVNFEIQSYFTEATIDESCFINEKKSISLWAYQIPELNDSGILDNYRSVITVFSLGGDENLFQSWSGLGDIKYASVPIDKVIYYCGSLERAINANYDAIIGTCTHEFIHTIEQGIVCYEYHSAYQPYIPSNIMDKLYLLNQWACGISSDLNLHDLDIEELKNMWAMYEKGGIPYSVWANNIFNVRIATECINGRPDGYAGVGTVDSGGTIYFYDPDNYDGWRKHSNEYHDYNILKVPQGSRTTWLFVEAKRGYKFLYWSDGIEDPLRVITDVQEDIELIAYFERLSYTVEYIASEGGRIEGETVQTLLTGELTSWVTAVPDEGYRFVGWSDGRTTVDRYDLVGVNERDENGESYYRLGFTVTAIFEKIDNESV